MWLSGNIQNFLIISQKVQKPIKQLCILEHTALLWMMNRLKKIDEIEKIDGVFVVVGDKVGIKGKIPELVKTDKKITLGELFDIY